jgi:tetratricopeptide (TPR) repeat protein
MKRLSFVLVAALLSPASAKAQSACAQLGVNCGHSSSSSRGSSRGEGRSNAPEAPNLAEIAARQARALNDAGITAYNKGDWTTAEALFKRALETRPNDPVILRNLATSQAQEGEEAYKKGDYTTALHFFQQAFANDPPTDKETKNGQNIKDALSAAESKIAASLREQAQRQQDRIAAANMQQSIQGLAQALSAAPSSGALELEFKGATSTGTFGDTISNPGLEFSTGTEPVAVHSTADQLASAAISGAAATAKGISEETAKVKSNCSFDTAACAKFVPISIHRVIAQSPGTVALAAHIPGLARNDTEVQQSIAYYQRLDGRKIETQVKLAALQKQIASGAGNADALKAQRATLTNDLKRCTADQATTQAQIRQRLKTIKVDWIEGSAPAAGAKAVQ